MKGTRWLTPVLSVGLAAGVSYGCLKGYLYYQITSELDNLIKSAGPFVQIEYQSVSTQLLAKSYSIHGVTIKPPNNQEPVSIDTLTFYGANFFAPQSAWFDEFDLSSNQYAAVSIKGLQFSLDEVMIHPAMARGPNIAELTSLGYDEVNTDLFFSISTNAETRELSLKFDQFNQEMFGLGLKATFTVPGFQKGGPLQAQNLQLSHASIEYTDDSILEKYMNAQAHKSGQSLEAYKAQMLQNLEGTLSSKQLKLSQEELTVLKNTIFDYQPMTLSIQPENPMGMEAFRRLRLYKPEDVSKMLKLKITNSSSRSFQE